MSGGVLGRARAELRQYAADLESEKARVQHAIAALTDDPEQTAADHLLAVLRAEPTRAMTATVAGERMVRHGWHSRSVRPTNVVATALSRLVRDGIVQRERRGVYRLIEDPS